MKQKRIEPTQPPGGLAEFVANADVELYEHVANQERVRKLRERVMDADLRDKRIAPRGRGARHTEESKRRASLATKKALLEHDFVRDAIVAPLLHWATPTTDDDPKRARRDKIPTRFADDREALRSWYGALAPVRSGEAARNFDRISLGATVQTSVRNHEPWIDEAVEAVERALRGLDPEDARWLVETYVELDAPAEARTIELEYVPRFLAEALQIRRREDPQKKRPKWDPESVSDDVARARAVERHAAYRTWHARKADIVGRIFRESIAWIARDEHHRVVDCDPDAALRACVEAEGPDHELVDLPIGSPIGFGVDARSATEIAYTEKLAAEKGMRTALPPHYCAAFLVAERAGLPMGEDARKSTNLVKGRVQRAREAFRASLETVQLEDGRWLVPIAPKAPKDGGTVETLECCAGARFANGLRMPCRVVGVEGSVDGHPARTWAACSSCELPIVPQRSKRSA